MAVRPGHLPGRQPARRRRGGPCLRRHLCPHLGPAGESSGRPRCSPLDARRRARGRLPAAVSVRRHPPAGRRPAGRRRHRFPGAAPPPHRLARCVAVAARVRVLGQRARLVPHRLRPTWRSIPGGPLGARTASIRRSTAPHTPGNVHRGLGTFDRRACPQSVGSARARPAVLSVGQRVPSIRQRLAAAGGFRRDLVVLRDLPGFNSRTAARALSPRHAG